jgi:hypothetical protein
MSVKIALVGCMSVEVVRIPTLINRKRCLGPDFAVFQGSSLACKQQSLARVQNTGMMSASRRSYRCVKRPGKSPIAKDSSTRSKMQQKSCRARKG